MTQCLSNQISKNYCF